MLFGIICILLWGLIPVVSVLGMQGLDQYQFLFWSSFISFITLAVTTAQSKQLHLLKNKDIKFWLTSIALGLMGTFFYYYCLYQGYLFGTKVEVLSVQYTWPAWVIVFSLLINKLRFRWYHACVIVAGMCSVLLVISKGDLSQLMVPNIKVLSWVLIGAFSFALFSVLSTKVSMPSLPLNTVFFGVATVASLILLFVNSSFAFPSQNNIIALSINGIFVNGISYYFWVLALRNTKADYLSLLTFLTPLVSVIYLRLFFNEAFYSAYYIAFGLVVVSGAVSVLASKTSAKH